MTIIDRFHFNNSYGKLLVMNIIIMMGHTKVSVKGGVDMGGSVVHLPVSRMCFSACWRRISEDGLHVGSQVNKF